MSEVMSSRAPRVESLPARPPVSSVSAVTVTRLPLPRLLVALRPHLASQLWCVVPACCEPLLSAAAAPAALVAPMRRPFVPAPPCVPASPLALAIQLYILRLFSLSASSPVSPPRLCKCCASPRSPSPLACSLALVLYRYTPPRSARPPPRPPQKTVAKTRAQHAAHALPRRRRLPVAV